MDNKLLSETNPYLLDKTKQKVGLFISVYSPPPLRESRQRAL